MKECGKAVRDYIRKYNPYESASKLGYNIAEMYRYAVANNRKVSELTKEEAEQFAVNS